MFSKTLNIYLFFAYLTQHNSATASPKPLPPPHKELLKTWNKNPKGQTKFVMKDKKGQIIEEGQLEWNLKENIWIFHYKKFKLIIKNNKLIKEEQNKQRIYPCSGFTKIFAKKIEEWHTIMAFDSEVQIDKKVYTSFKTNKSYMVICFTPDPFKLISVIFSENNEPYILLFE